MMNRGDFLESVPCGRMDSEHAVRLLDDVSAKAGIIGLALTEYLSSDSIQTQWFRRHATMGADG